MFPRENSGILYSENFDHDHFEECPHFLVCGSDDAENPFTKIVDLDELENLAWQNYICSAYVICFDGVAEIDWRWIDGEFKVVMGE